MLNPTRRQVLQTFGAGAAALALSPWKLLAADEKKKGFEVPKLPYAYDALEPHIDARTMEIHHDRHHKAYVDGLNKALADHSDLLEKPIDAILSDIKSVPPGLRQAVINSGGGHSNHTMFWEIMKKDGGGKPSGDLAKAIDEAFGTFDKMQTQLSEAAVKQFGSGWGWLVLDKGKLRVLATGNQNSPLLVSAAPLMGIDVWEHAYYLKYQNKRADYVKAWWNVVNWDAVNERYKRAGK